MSLNESIVEDAALEWFGELGYAVGHLPAPRSATRQAGGGEPAAESACASPADRRDSFGEVVLVGRLREAIRRLNPAITSASPISSRRRSSPTPRAAARAIRPSTPPKPSP